VSALKLQLGKILPGLSSQANKNKDREVKRRLYLIQAVVRSPKSVAQVCESRGVSADSFYNWARLLLKGKGDLSSLKPGSTKPKHCPHQTPKRIEKRIRNLRLAEPSHGSDRISFDLKRLFNMVCAPSTVYAVLLRLGMITEEYKKKLTKEHIKRYRRPFPGWLQMDIKYVPYFIDGDKYYEFNIVDHCSSWRCMRVYENKSYESLQKFLKEIEANCPFPIVEIQTDNGKEFTDKYRVGSDGKPTGYHPLDQWCKQKEIRHKLIPIGEKELNGKVENTHRQDDREFYAKYYFNNFEEIEKAMRSWNERWNTQRATKTLHWKTPNEVLLLSCVSWVAHLINVQSKSKGTAFLFAKIDRDGNIFLPVPKRKNPPRPKKPRRKNYVDRYLQWADGEAKKLKSFMVLPTIYQIFSKFCF
jgi:transposase InsO family protein